LVFAAENVSACLSLPEPGRGKTKKAGKKEGLKALFLAGLRCDGPPGPRPGCPSTRLPLTYCCAEFPPRFAIAAGPSTAEL
jgi:hypothetical protein